MDFTEGDYPDAVVNGDYDGCVQECREDEVLIVDPRLGDWSCVPKVVNATLLDTICPGKFNTGIHPSMIGKIHDTCVQSAPVLVGRRNVL